jgi:pilus assembly protein Flp/PilA
MPWSSVARIAAATAAMDRSRIVGHDGNTDSRLQHRRVGADDRREFACDCRAGAERRRVRGRIGTRSGDQPSDPMAGPVAIRRPARSGPGPLAVRGPIAGALPFEAAHARTIGATRGRDVRFDSPHQRRKISLEGLPQAGTRLSAIAISAITANTGGTRMMSSLIRFLNDDDAATAVEYSVMLAMILLVCFSAIGMVGTKTSSLWTTIVSSVRSFGM